MQNINKINDAILALSELRDKVTVAVLRGNAGAGGEMLSAACDVVLSHPVSRSSCISSYVIKFEHIHPVLIKDLLKRH